MRITTLKLLLSAIAVSVVTMLAAGPAAAVGTCPAPVTLHLDTGGALDESAPGAGTAAFVELPGLHRGDPYQQIGGVWAASNVNSDAACTNVYDLQLWLGLRNSDDQGTNVDLKVEVTVDGVTSTKEFLCVKGLTRNPALAAQIDPSDFFSIANDGTLDVALKVSAKISDSCGGHVSATGLRLYYGSAARDSHFVIGQASAESTPCPKTGCSLDATSDDGSTSVDVTVPGGGKVGTLTIVLSTAPTDDGCPLGEGGGPIIGSLVTVVPPGGYTAGNPIVVDITYNGEVSVNDVCKSNNGNPPFTKLPMCTFGNSSTPTNVPCWEYAVESSNEVIVYMTSQDPAFTAH
jgi:hypothetical protein